MKKTFLKWLLLVSVATSLLVGCGAKKDLTKIEGNPETLYKEGLARFNRKDYTEALKKFEDLKSSFPDSPPYTLWAELKVGDCHFLKKEYVEAIATYEEFKKTHPSHEEIPYVQFQIGMSYFNQMRGLDRDQTPTKKALSSFEYLIASHPSGLFTEKAREKVAVCKKRLADHEFYVGNFYYKHGRFEAAASRFEGLLEKFPRLPGEDETLYLLGKSYLELDQWRKAEAALRKLLAEYPKSPHAEEAKEIINKDLAKMEASHRKMTEGDRKDESAAIEPGKIALVKFEEEGKSPVSLQEGKKFDLREEGERSPSLAATGAPAKAIPPKKNEAKKGVSPSAIEPTQEDRIDAIPPSGETKKIQPVVPAEPTKKDRVPDLLPLPSADIASKVEVQPDEEKRVAAIPFKEEENVKKKVLPETKEAKLAGPADKSQPIDITSDKVEARWKENLVIFKGNVIARQKDMVIYADSVEVLTNEDGKGIERVIAEGNVKIQQGLRVANCQKAVFHNPEQKLFLTGDPKVSEGENIVLGDEIIFDIDKNRVEVKGGPSGRGKVKVQPGEVEKLK
jgi:outer membrane protein assembly factor BamD